MLALVASMAAAVLVSVVEPPAPAAAADPAAFRPGSIISDALFFDGGAMTAGDVQAFLNLKVPACASGYTCLKDYVQATNTRPAESGLCNGYTGKAAETAAQIIANVGASCGVSQKVLLVTLQKENSLVTRTSPPASAYQTAMGFGCPDSAACDSQYYGLFNQIYSAARQFKRYAMYPASYSYRAGRDNSILFNPSTACGRSTVYIENQATAGLYDYTPYQPNGAALANLYGTGDSCSSYGNRNFWRDYTDWFGSTQIGANLVRTAANPTVYLITFDHKYPVSDLTVLDSLSVLGTVGVVDQSFLDAKTTGVTLGRFIRDRSGIVYLFDRGYLFPVRDCAQLADWGANCDDYGTMALSDIQMSGWVRGGTLTNDVLTTDTGQRFLVSGGTKREVADDASLALAPGPVDPPTAVRAAALAGLGYGAPVVRNDVLVRDRSTGDYLLTQPGGTLAVASGIVATDALDRSLPALPLDHASALKMPSSGRTILGAVADGAGHQYLLSPQGTITLPSALGVAASLVPVVSDGVVASLRPSAGVPLLRSLDVSTLYLASAGTRRSISTMAIASALAAPAAVRVSYVSSALLNAVPEGVPVLAPGSLVKSTDAAQVYLVNGTTGLVPLSDFSISSTLGIATWTAVPPANLVPYQVAAAPLTTLVACGSERLVGTGSGVATLPTDLVSSAAAPMTSLDASTCSTLRREGSNAASALFLRSPTSPVLYLAENGTRREVRSMTTAYALSPSSLAIALVPQPQLDAMAGGSPVATPGTLVKGSGSPIVYLVDGADGLVPLPSFAISDALGIAGFTTVPDSELTGYAVASDPLSSLLTTGSEYLVGSNGVLTPLAPAGATSSGMRWTHVTAGTVARFPRAAVSQGPLFVRSYDDATVYLVSVGTLRPVTSMTRLYQLAPAPLIGMVAPAVLAGMPIGPAA